VRPEADVTNNLPRRPATPAKNTMSAKKATLPLAKKAGPAQTKKTAPRNPALELVLRADKAPANQLDYDDKHDTRATESEEKSELYAALRKDQRKDEWHRVAMGLTVLVVALVVYLAGFLVVAELHPRYDALLVAKIVALGFALGGGGVIVRSAGRAVKKHYDRRRGKSDDVR
jgi:hypothetical protein